MLPQHQTRDKTERDKTEKGLFAVERFTSRGLTALDLEQIRSSDVAYRITTRR